MRITYLKLKNFLHIYSGLNKTEIELDFSQSKKVINIIIGKMGSCKSVILGHLQPFSGFGTLDPRSQDGIILENEDGEKIIRYQKESDEYCIVHKYSWKNGRHSVKSFVKRNDVELNPSGNVTSFRSLIEMELGITPSDLSMIRLGPNVTNLIDMSAAERKAYMSARLKDTHIYATLYKKLNEEMRNLHAQATILSSKITSVTKGSIEGMKEEKLLLSEAIESLQDDLSTATKNQGGYIARVKTIYGSDTAESYGERLNLYRNELQKLLKSIHENETSIHAIQTNFRSIAEVSEKLGAVKSKISRNTEDLMHLEQDYTSKGNELGKLQEQLRSLGDKEQIDNLRETYSDITMKLAAMEEDVENFHCPYGTAQIRALIAQLNPINELISDIDSYNHDSVMNVLHSGADVIRRSSQKIEMLTRRRTSIQRKISNLQFANQYIPDEVLYFPPMCPTHDCPWYKTHPDTLQRLSGGLDLPKEFEEYQKEIDQIDHEIDQLNEYPIIYGKIQSLRNLWGDAIVKLKELKALKVESLVKIFSTIFTKKWYDYDKLVDILAMCVKRDQYYELEAKSQAMRAELISLSSKSFDQISENINRLEKEIDETASAIAMVDENTKKLKNQQKELEDAYQKLLVVENMIHDTDEMKREASTLQQKIQEMEDGQKQADLLTKSISDLNIRIMTINTSIREHQEKINAINSALNDISYAQKEFMRIQEDQSVLREIVESVSSNKGIPLVYVKIFLNQCKDTVNDLIADVFGDAIEILDFDISESDFKIPYSINGSPVKDIASASQGQQSIISLALSFALVRQSLSEYNIMLLDEMDGPLYKDDRDKFISILYKQIQAIHAEQVFLVSHNNTFDGHNVNIIMTTEEHVDRSPMITVMQV